MTPLATPFLYPPANARSLSGKRAVARLRHGTYRRIVGCERRDSEETVRVVGEWLKREVCSGFSRAGTYRCDSTGVGRTDEPSRVNNQTFSWAESSYHEKAKGTD